MNKIPDPNLSNVAPRHKIDLRSWVVATFVRKDESDHEEYVFLRAKTHDVSLTGLSLIVSSSDAQQLLRLGINLVIRLLLPLSGQPIELEAQTVRYERWLEEDSGAVLIGAHITNIDEIDYDVLIDFINALEAQ